MGSQPVPSWTLIQLHGGSVQGWPSVLQVAEEEGGSGRGSWVAKVTWPAPPGVCAFSPGHPHGARRKGPLEVMLLGGLVNPPRGTAPSWPLTSVGP